MSELSLAYIFHHQQLLVDQNLQLPKVEKLASDLLFTHDEQVIARDLLAEEPIPEGLQLVPIRQLITSWSKEQFLQASRAVQLLEWRRNHKFCSHCGHPTEVHPTEYAMVCPSCRYHQYPRVNPCIITVITRGDDEILLAKSVHNKTNMYGLIAGFVEVGETLEEAVQREAFEEVGLKLKNIQYMSSQPWPFPSNLMVAFRAEYESGEIKLQEEEIADAQFFKIDQLPEIPFKGSIAHSMIMQITQTG
ncbi:NAD(+) diphosphatase [Acinetobacter pittii]|uniref:NAD(+) diphosphatase n=2 Tax=Acinetobacter pittii TaxID=48296 RepID=F0KHH2_ACIP2|nr:MULTISPECIES: NAD(+) diphosphatase [Acinetobacter calcoaceticus/baumannii complex]YP_004994602.1 putative NADH pyrophosphatase (NUDIX hydrolase family) [Acinetobacter pittii PHEA-2]ADY80920.1 putative NADH pyrophosphatase (NUDIX hydrolase family) [Acinetobacter pittii PHEA-2]EXC25856.1 NUDIX domain protein [Acinetobacter sp. 809848]KRI63428.1 NADH pyrophosphatase [Acinetobacter pittii]ODL96571.1 NADH pyrophosphatase [Acinetobacter pittii]PPC01484.1 NAD(+) diphosphatase [Acinetobacter pitti